MALPEMPPSTAPPLVYAIPVQLVSHHNAVMMGVDGDQPRIIAKSVMLEHNLIVTHCYRQPSSRDSDLRRPEGFHKIEAWHA